MYVMKKMLSKQRSLGKRISGITMPITRKRMRWSRNWPCLCGSGKKYKKCCLGEMNSITTADGNANIELIPEDMQKMIQVYLDQQKEKNKRETEKKDGGLNKNE